MDIAFEAGKGSVSWLAGRTVGNRGKTFQRHITVKTSQAIKD